MPGIVRPILIGGGWGVALGAAATVATVLAPTLRPVALRALKGYLEAAALARQRTVEAAAYARERGTERSTSLQDLYKGNGGGDNAEPRR